MLGQKGRRVSYYKVTCIEEERLAWMFCLNITSKPFDPKVLWNVHCGSINLKQLPFEALNKKEIKTRLQRMKMLHYYRCFFSWLTFGVLGRLRKTPPYNIYWNVCIRRTNHVFCGECFLSLHKPSMLNNATAPQLPNPLWQRYATGLRNLLFPTSAFTSPGQNSKHFLIVQRSNTY